MRVRPAFMLALVLVWGLLSACADAVGPAASGSSSESDGSSTTPLESNSDTTGPASLCVNGTAGSSIIDYMSPSPGAKQSPDEALARFNGSANLNGGNTYVMSSDGWAVATDEGGNVIGVATLEELDTGYWVVGGTIECR